MKIFDYEDIQLIPNKCIVKSRSECDTTVQFGKYSFKMPVVPANMQTIVDEDLSMWLAENGYFYVMHRFEEEKDSEYTFIEHLKNINLIPEYITIDIAHGHSDQVIAMIKHIKQHIPEAFVIAGNVGTPEGVRELENAGADATKVGIGPGKVCITKLKTGFGTGGWQLSALNWCAKAARKPVIADGGIRDHGDIAKSIRFGATMCMIGSLFAGHEESPGSTIEIDGERYKEYYGSASEYQKGERKNVEGKKILIQHKGNIEDTLNEIRQDLQSSISYAGGRDLESIRKVDYVIVKNSIFNGDR